MFHSASSVPTKYGDWQLVIFGGRESPLRPLNDIHVLLARGTYVRANVRVRVKVRVRVRGEGED